MFSALSQIAKHSVDLAEMVVEAEIFPAVLNCLKGIRMKYYFKYQIVMSILLIMNYCFYLVQILMNMFAKM